MKLFDKFCMVVCILIVGIILGYGWRMHHEGLINIHYQSQAEDNLNKLENEFHEAIAHPRSFQIFQGQFIVWPVDIVKKRFYYKGRK